jgi:hypothetical protein
MYKLVKKYDQNLYGVSIATVSLKINIFTLKLRANVVMKNGSSFVLESYRYEENLQFEDRLMQAIFMEYENSQ